MTSHPKFTISCGLHSQGEVSLVHRNREEEMLGRPGGLHRGATAPHTDGVSFPSPCAVGQTGRKGLSTSFRVTACEGAARSSDPQRPDSTATDCRVPQLPGCHQGGEAGTVGPADGWEHKEPPLPFTSMKPRSNHRLVAFYLVTSLTRERNLSGVLTSSMQASSPLWEQPPNGQHRPLGLTFPLVPLTMRVVSSDCTVLACL